MDSFKLTKSTFYKYTIISSVVLITIVLTSYTLFEKFRNFNNKDIDDLVVADGLAVQLMASEPLLKNPTNITVDEKGRVWVTEAYNYRFSITKRPTNPDGDRIVILEDTNQDGVMEKSTVFYQGPEINAPLGICVLGKKVIVSQSPYIWAFYDDNEDGKADRKEIMFQGIGGEQHDHGAHKFIFGPDGKLYFNFGNAGVTLQDKNGKTVLDQDGDEIDAKKYRQGMVFRCDPDGKNVEVLADNFRNIFEVAVDSYGTMWQSDNDDDGNKSTRINYVMEYGNYGYTDEMTGAGWRINRTNIEKEIPSQHWHQNDPGVVPNLLLTGAGSPSGMTIYEGNLLPEIFQNQMIHCEPGSNEVRAYPVKNSEAGYSATIKSILKNDKDQWFRPSDVVVAPDGSVIVADWYDPVVGGHQAGDLDKGRIYRVFPKGKTQYINPKFDFNTSKGVVEALQNPNLTVRFKAWVAIQEMGKKAIPEIEKLWRNQNENPRMRARALWVLSKTSNGSKYIQEAVKDKNYNLRIVALRASRERKDNIASVVEQLVNDPEPQVRRECAIALHHNNDPRAPKLWSTLASKYDGVDRWYLEALGIGADGQWDAFFKAYESSVGDPTVNESGKNIVWRARTPHAMKYLGALASNDKINLNDRLKYFRAFDFNDGKEKSETLLAMLESNLVTDLNFAKLVLRHLDANSVKASQPAQNALKNVLNNFRGTSDYIDIIDQYDVSTENENLLKLALEKASDPLGSAAAGALVKIGGSDQLVKAIKSDQEKAKLLVTSLATVGSTSSIELLEKVAFDKTNDIALRKSAASALGRSRGGRVRAQQLIGDKNTPGDILDEFKANISATGFGAPVVVNATQPAELSSQLREIIALKANVTEGKAVYQKLCFVCHQVNGQGIDFGPNLSEIGSKLPKEGLFTSIVNPSLGLSFGYETSEIAMNDGSTVNGIVISRTETDVVVKYPGGSTETLKAVEIKSITELKNSFMPDGLDKAMSKQEFADLLEYLSSLKKTN